MSITQLVIDHLARKEAVPQNALKPASKVIQSTTHKTFIMVCLATFSYFIRFQVTWSYHEIGASSYSVHKRVEDIQLEIMNNGPVEGALTVYEDFPIYKSGIQDCIN